jgi:glutamate N-acetyltransferase/amino-acid N-acetyltransferase
VTNSSSRPTPFPTRTNGRSFWPEGLVSAGVACGIKRSGKLDLGVLVSGRPVVWAGTFTRNAAAAACVGYDRARLGSAVRAVIVNSGNANACTGPPGDRAVNATAAATSEALGCPADEVLVCSTGPIGVPLDASLIANAIPAALDGLSQDVDDFARAIMTTDTFPKVATARVDDATVCGVAKGAAMLAPNMATMLSFVATDADVTHEVLQGCLDGAVDKTFNRLCLDACESTNDTAIALATGTGKAVKAQDLGTAIESVARDLAVKIARDAEGGTKLIRIAVSGAADEVSAADLGKAVAASDLWRSAVHGGDPNWGRVLSALGAKDRELDLNEVRIAIGDEVVFDKGAPSGLLAAAAAALHSDHVIVTCEVGAGPGRAEVLSADLSEEYVSLNAQGSS